MGNEVLELRTSANLLDALSSACIKHPTAGELLEQQVSFVYSSLGPKNGITREQVKQALVEKAGG